MNTKENIKNAIMKMAFSDPRGLWKALNLVTKRIEVSFRFEITVGWMFNNLRVFGYIFEREDAPFRSNAIKEEDIDFISAIIDENAEDLSTFLAPDMAQAIGLEVPEETYNVQVRSKQYWNVVLEADNLTESEVVEALREYVGRPYVVKMYANLVGEWVDSWQFVTSRIDKTELEAEQ